MYKVYSPQSTFQTPLGFIFEVASQVWEARQTIGQIFIRDLKAQFRQSYLGYIWAFVPALASTGVWLYLSSQNIVKISATPIPYAAHVLIGTTLWSAFTLGVNTPLNSFNSGKSVFTKLNVAPEVFIFAGMANGLFDLVLKLTLFVPMFFLLKMSLPVTAFLFPLGLLGILLMGMAFGLILIPVGGLYNDVGRVVSLGMGFLMYLTPVVYPLPKEGLSAKLANLNPATHAICVSRDWLTMGASEHLIPFLWLLLASFLLFLFGILLVRKTMPHIIARMGM